MTWEPQQIALALLLIQLMGGSVLVWAQIAARLTAGQPLLEQAPRPSPQFHPLAVVLAAAWVALILVNRLLGGSEAVQPTLRNVQGSCALNALVIGILPVLLVSGDLRRLPEFGIRGDHLPRQIGDGLLGFLASILPIAAALVVTQGFRGRETQHSFLKLLLDEPTPPVIFWIALAVMVFAPLAEELVFRVILQGWLEQRVSPHAAIATVAIVFSFIHGWRDGIPLLPLAFILGYVFHQRRSYAAVAVLHGLFNGTMLVLALLGASGERGASAP